MKRFMVVFVCVVVVVAAGTVYADSYRILHKQGAIYNTDTGWTLTTPPYYPGVDWAVDLVADSEGITILHKDGAMWNDTGGWDMSSPPYYPGSNYAQALDAGPEEVRIPISSLPYTITQSGSYYITGDLTAAGTGITVEADNVTIDLMGYSLIGPGTGTNYGIYMNGRSNVEVRNGTITNFGSYGIYEPSIGKNHRIVDMRAVDNGDTGIYLAGHGNLVKGCTASENAYRGIDVGLGSTVTGNTVYNNDSIGINTATGTVTGNTAYNNGNHGIYASGTVTGNTASSNSGRGIYTFGTATVTGNIAVSNGDSGIRAGVGSTVTGNAARGNQNEGISLAGNNLVDGNSAYSNCQSGGCSENIETCGNCTWGTNHNPVIP